MPGQRVFTPRYRLFIPSSTKLPPAVMLGSDRALERSVGPGRSHAVSGVALLELVVRKIVRAGLRHKHFRYVARGWLPRGPAGRNAGGQPFVTLQRVLCGSERFACRIAGRDPDATPRSWLRHDARAEGW